jgi:hypothetical protein
MFKLSFSRAYQKTERRCCRCYVLLRRRCILLETEIVRSSAKNVDGKTFARKRIGVGVADWSIWTPLKNGFASNSWNGNRMSLGLKQARVLR